MLITLIRYILLCQKRVKLKLAFYGFLEQISREIIGNNEDLQKKFIHELTEIIHNKNQNKPETTEP